MVVEQNIDERVERVVCQPGDPVMTHLKRLFDARRMSWRIFCWLWEFRRRVLLAKLNPALRYRFGAMPMLNAKRLRPSAVPVVINNFNRLESLRRLIEWLQGLEGNVSIIILDNASSYPPLLEYYDALASQDGVQVIRLGYNSGLEGLADIQKELDQFDRYIVTDPDLVPYDSTPSDILSQMSAVLDRIPDIQAIGVSLEIDDIPAHYPLREKVLAWESRYWPPTAKHIEAHIFEAWVDTTFAMYRRGADIMRITPSARMDRPYTLKHVDWYLDPEALNDEQMHYQSVCQPIASWTTRAQGRLNHC